ncbi:hypothetical protein, partial [Achromobacter denitrificans]|uniref:hypothetical protein n=1 Tax=Achromobacter denitrificans TaxID=32002 RepID=UPI0015826F83
GWAGADGAARDPVAEAGDCACAVPAAAAAMTAAVSTLEKVSIRKRMERWRMAILKNRSQPGSYRDPAGGIEPRGPR